MQDDFEIRSSAFPYNMSGWCTEKSDCVVSHLARFVDELRQNDTLTESQKDDLCFHLYAALHDATKMMAFSCGANWSAGSPDLVIQEGYAGYEKVAVKYGLLEETSLSKQAKRRRTFLSELDSLLNGPRYPGRTLIHEKLASCGERGPIIEHLSQLAEGVTMGETDWDEFVVQAKPLLEQLRQEWEPSA